MQKPFLFFLLLALTTTSAHAEVPAPIDGWGKLKFGMSVQEAVEAMPEAELAAWPNCIAENIIKNGCFLSPLTPAAKRGIVGADPNYYYRATIEGLAFNLRIDFDRFNRLYNVHLDYFENDGVTTNRVNKNTCIKFLHRTIEGLEKRYGVLQSTEPTLDAESKAKGYVKTAHVTSGGTTYHLTTYNKQDDLIDLTAITNDPTAYAENVANAKSDNEENRASRPFLSINGGASDKSCMFWINYTAATFENSEEVTPSDNAEF